jgi:hypothetical protein
VVHEEIPKGEAAVKPVRPLKKQHLNNTWTFTFYLTEKIFIIKTIQLVLFRTPNHYFHKEHRKPILSRFRVTIGRVWFDAWIYWPLIHTTQNYK